MEQVRLWMEQIVVSLGYFGIGLMMLIENIFPPIPSEVIMPFAGSLAAKGDLSLVGVFISGTLGALLGAGVIYGIGIAMTEQRVRGWFGQYGRYLLLTTDDFDRALRTFHRRGQEMVLLGRLLPTIRSLISLPAGLDEMNLTKFFVYTTLGTSLWNLVLIAAGVWLGENWSQALNVINRYELVVWIILILLMIYFIVRRVQSLIK